jgi:hypothetical protein
MRMRSAVLIGAVAVVAGALAGCPSDSCPLETPQVSTVPGTCQAAPGQQVSYPVRLCPACNQTGATCSADLSQVANGYIYLDVKAEACSSGSSCPTPSCDTNPTSCTFTAPAASSTPYNVVIPDGQGGTITRQLEVQAGATYSCALASAP